MAASTALPPSASTFRPASLAIVLADTTMPRGAETVGPETSSVAGTLTAPICEQPAASGSRAAQMRAARKRRKDMPCLEKGVLAVRDVAAAASGGAVALVTAHARP